MITKTLSKLLATITRNGKLYSVVLLPDDDMGAVEITTGVEFMPAKIANDLFIPLEVVENPYNAQCVTVYVVESMKKYRNKCGSQAVMLDDIA